MPSGDLWLYSAVAEDTPLFVVAMQELKDVFKISR